ncbi:MAG: hypothetical protein KatS3mg124_2224 [Porticoccaceae bacterium]|nr:MAG: hypothetical protein KatS3mg124_2224 [Porticoccaceae bacterium]
MPATSPESASTEPDPWPGALLDPAVYPHPVGELTLVETHISWVVLTGQWAYKFKRPVNLGFVDFSTPERRRHFCERELALNRRFAPELYRAVVPVTGSRARPRLEGAGEPIDHALAMRQFDPDEVLARLAERGLLDEALVGELARTLAALHDALPPLAEAEAQRARRAFVGVALDNVRWLDRALRLPAERRALRAARAFLVAALRRSRPLRRARAAGGRFVDGHGDLHLGNLVRFGGRLVPFDCIEFDDSLRRLDRLAELAFLAMDLEARGLAARSRQLRSDYLEWTGDHEGLPLFDLYRCHYALVRAKVALAAGASPRRHLALARLAARPRRPWLCLLHGPSGSGKSWLAARIVAATGALRLRSDVERKRLFGLAPEQSGRHVAGLYERPASERTFARLLELARAVVAAGFPCAVDATFLGRDDRAPFLAWARKAGLPVAVVAARAPEAEIRARLAARRGDASDADWEVYLRQRERVEPVAAEEADLVLAVDTADAAAVAAALGRLARFARSAPRREER